MANIRGKDIRPIKRLEEDQSISNNEINEIIDSFNNLLEALE